MIQPTAARIVAAVAASAGKNVSMAISSRVTSRGEPNTVVVYSSASSPNSVDSRSGTTRSSCHPVEEPGGAGPWSGRTSPGRRGPPGRRRSSRTASRRFRRPGSRGGRRARRAGRGGAGARRCPGRPRNPVTPPRGPPGPGRIRRGVPSRRTSNRSRRVSGSGRGRPGRRASGSRGRRRGSTSRLWHRRCRRVGRAQPSGVLFSLGQFRSRTCRASIARSHETCTSRGAPKAPVDSRAQ